MKKKILKAIIAVALMIATTACVVACGRTQTIDWVSYEVEEGDSLWAIVVNHADIPSGHDIGSTIRLIEDHNGITARIYPGQTIYIPVINERN